MNTLCRLVCLFVASVWVGSAWAGPTIQLPDGEDLAVWGGALGLAGLVSGDERAPLRLERTDEAWRIVAVAQDGRVRRVQVDVPQTGADREAVAFLARALLREVLQSSRRRSMSSPAGPKIPAVRAAGEEADRRAPPSKGVSGWPHSDSPHRVVNAGELQLAGTSEATPIGPPSDAELERHVSDLSAWGGTGGSRFAVPPLWLRIGTASRPGLTGAAQLMAGSEIYRRGRLRLNLELGGSAARDVGLGLALRLGRLDAEGSATLAAIGPASIGAGLGGSYRTYREGQVLVDRHLVPTAQLRLDVPLISRRKLAVVAHLQGKFDLMPTSLSLPDGRAARRPIFEIQPALIIRYHGALGLLSDYGGPIGPRTSP